MIEARQIPEQYTQQRDFSVTTPSDSEQTWPQQVDETSVVAFQSDTKTFTPEIASHPENTPLKVFTRDRSLTDHPQVEMIPLGERGERRRYKGKPPRNQPIAIAVDHMDGYVGTAFPQNVAGAQGFHAEPDAYMTGMVIARRQNTTREPRKDRFVMFHGATKTEIHKNGQKANRVIEIYGMHPEDITQNGGEKEALRMLERINRSHEKGQVIPEHYIGDHLAQRMLSAFDADELRIVYSERAHRIYQEGTRKPLPRQFREGD